MTDAALPALDTILRMNSSPHVVILGAGASKAATPFGDAAGRKLPLMDDLPGITGVDALLERAGVEWRGRNFEALYSELVVRSELSELRKDLERGIREYFSRLQLPAAPTTYDYLLLSLREKDLIATFNWDPLLVQAYRRNMKLRRLPSVVFLHGNVGIGICRTCRGKHFVDRPCVVCGDPLDETPLLYPVVDKDYDADEFIASEWTELKATLRRAYFLTVFGYRAPASDASAIDLMKTAWSDNRTRVLAETEVIDIRDRSELKVTWDSFIVRQHYGIIDDFFKSYLSWHPRRSCEALAFATLQNDPWPDDWMPTFESLAELHSWIEPLIHEEAALEGGVALSGRAHGD
jgi:hypothetical protein